MKAAKPKPEVLRGWSLKRLFGLPVVGLNGPARRKLSKAIEAMARDAVLWGHLLLPDGTYKVFISRNVEPLA